MLHKTFGWSLKTSLITKSLLIVVLFFWLRIFLGCVPPEPEDFFYNKISLNGFNNSGVAQGYAYTDTLYSEAAAFELTLSDSAYYYDNFYADIFRNIGFQQALAFEPLSEYSPVNRVEKISISTIYPLNNYFGEGAEITDSILFDPHNGFSVYSSLTDAVNYMNKIQSNPYSTVRLIVKPGIENTTAKFRISVHFTDGTSLSDTTKTFTIITPE